jgi:alpha-tubulin suppressor-like RCC1 family protein
MVYEEAKEAGMVAPSIQSIKWATGADDGTAGGPISLLKCGATHSAAVTGSGLWMFGRNNYGQLGQVSQLI